MKSYCMVLYGATQWDVTKPKINAFCSSWKRCVPKLTKINAKTYANLLYLVVEDLNIEGQIHSRIVQFRNSILTSHNPMLSRCGNLVKEGSRSSVSQSIRRIISKYNVHWNLLYDVKCMCDTIRKYYLTSSYTELEYLFDEIIKTLLYYTGGVMKSGVGCMLTDEELHIILDFLYMV